MARNGSISLIPDPIAYSAIRSHCSKDFAKSAISSFDLNGIPLSRNDNLRRRRSYEKERESESKQHITQAELATTESSHAPFTPRLRF
jgi:hypothetical protein